MLCYADNVFEVRTPADVATYVVDLPFHKSYITFGARVCADAFIEFDGILGNRATKSYLLELGSNHNSQVRRCGT
jgi:hypothetical protein